MDKLPETLQAIVDAIKANDRGAYDAALEAALQEEAFAIDESAYVDGLEHDALRAAFQARGYEGVPDFDRMREHIEARREPTLTRESFVACGVMLFGDDWKNPISRALGPLHPDGERDAIDDRLVRRWVSGDRPIPAWVRGACILLATQRKAALEAWLSN